LTTISGSYVTNRWYQKRFINRLIADALAVEAKANVYVRITPLHKAPASGRGLERHSAGTSVLFCDFDTYTNQIDGLNLLRGLDKPPTLIVNSGNGLHAYWLLDRFYIDLDAIKARNKQLAVEINKISPKQKADSCYDLARVLRAPGTYNVKNPDKPIACTVVEFEPTRIYTLNDFAPASLEDDAIEIQVWDQVPLPADFIDGVRERDKKLAQRIISEDGARKQDAATNGDGKIDRSRNDAYVVTRLLALGYRPEECMSVLMSPDWFSGAKYRDTGRFDYVVTTVNELYANWQRSPDRYFIKTSFQPEQMGQELYTAGRYIYTAERLWRYHNGVYCADAEQFVREQVAKRLGRRWLSRYADETVQWLQDTSRCPIERINQYEGLINCLNGMIDASTGALMPHDPKYLSTVQVPAAYDPDADTSAIDRFFADVLPADAIPMLWEYIGSAFILSRYWPKAFVTLVGAKNSGKSKVLELIGAFYGGRDNVAALSIQTLADNRFATSTLFGKVANVFSDLDEAEAQNTGHLKALTGDDVISGEQKFAGFFVFKNVARLFFSSNNYPAVRNPDEAYFGRAHIIRCSRVFNGQDANPRIVQELTTPANMSGMLRRAVEGLRRLLAQGDFTPSASVERENEQYRFNADTVSGFLHTCEFDADFYLPKQQLYQLYDQACKRANRKAVGDDKFFKRVSDNLARFGMTEEYKTINGSRVWCYAGRKPTEPATVNIPGVPYMVLN
jgi:putative DNA primase/helicase